MSTQLGMDLPRIEDAELDNVERAIVFASVAHHGQKDKAGRPYILHPLAVAKIVKERGGTEAQVIAALLHDVVEDTDYTLEQVRAEFGDEVAEIVDAVTQRPGEFRRVYIARCYSHPGGAVVKEADKESNMDPARRALLAPEVAVTLDAKYARDDQYRQQAGLR